MSVTDDDAQLDQLSVSWYLQINVMHGLYHQSCPPHMQRGSRPEITSVDQKSMTMIFIVLVIHIDTFEMLLSIWEIRMAKKCKEKGIIHA